MKLLLVDDEQIALKALKKRVDWVKYGFTDVLTAPDASAAREILKKDAIDMMLCDIEMPGESGLSLVEYVRETYPEIECVMVTCHADFSYVKRSIRLQVVDYILKPIDYDELEELLVRFVEKHTDREQKKQHEKRMKDLMDSGEEEPSQTKQRVERIMQYIDAHIQEKIRMEDVAKHLYINEQYMMRIFKQETGKTILEYVTDRRIRMAGELLRDSQYSISYIANAVGFENVSYFTKLFRKLTDYSPREYRAKFRKE